MASLGLLPWRVTRNKSKSPGRNSSRAAAWPLPVSLQPGTSVPVAAASTAQFVPATRTRPWRPHLLHVSRMPMPEEGPPAAGAATPGAPLRHFSRPGTALAQTRRVSISDDERSTALAPSELARGGAAPGSCRRCLRREAVAGAWRCGGRARWRCGGGRRGREPRAEEMRRRGVYLRRVARRCRPLCPGARRSGPPKVLPMLGTEVWPSPSVVWPGAVVPFVVGRASHSTYPRSRPSSASWGACRSSCGGFGGGGAGRAGAGSVVAWRRWMRGVIVGNPR